MLCSRTYFDMFGLAALEPSMRVAAKEYLRASVALDTHFFGRSDLDICQEKQALLARFASPGASSGGEGSSGDEGASDGTASSGSANPNLTLANPNANLNANPWYGPADWWTT